MTIYAIDEKLGNNVITAFIFLKYSDNNSLKKIFNILRVIYKFEPITVNWDYDLAQIKTLKEYDLYHKKPLYYMLSISLFITTIKIMKQLKLFKKYK